DDAVVLENRMFVPGQAGYKDTSGGGYDVVDIGTAKSVLESAGWTLDGDTYARNGQRLEFRLLHNSARSAEAHLINASGGRAGIAVVDDNDAAWSDRVGAAQFDAVVFSWFNSPLLSDQPAIYRSPPSRQDLGSNTGSYSNPEVDALMERLTTETDPAALI